MNHYIVICQHKDEEYVRERDLSDCTRDRVFDDLWSGNLQDVTRIWAITPTMVGDDCARDMAKSLGEYSFEIDEEPHAELAAWLRNHGVEYYTEDGAEHERSDRDEYSTRYRAYSL